MIIDCGASRRELPDPGRPELAAGRWTPAPGCPAPDGYDRLPRRKFAMSDTTVHRRSVSATSLRRIVLSSVVQIDVILICVDLMR